MLPDDFLRGVTVNALRPFVPGGNSALEVEAADHVIANCRYHQTESLLILLQRRFGMSAPFQIAPAQNNCQAADKHRKCAAGHHCQFRTASNLPGAVPPLSKETF